MLFNANDINLGNYEEFFILYMDNELTDDQRKMVDVFLLAHPDLQAELEMLMSTRLPAEEFSFNKEVLLSGSMKLNAVDEDVLLYIDGELTAEKKKIVELELASNPSYQLQHQHLLQTKLDASEVMAYPNKKELYRRTERVVAFKPWMRIAAAVIIIAAMGVFYFTGNNTTPVVPHVAEIKPAPSHNQPLQQQIKITEQALPQVAVTEPRVKQNSATVKTKQTNGEAEMGHTAQQALNTPDASSTDVVVVSPAVKETTAIVTHPTMEGTTASFDPSKEIINTSAVTSALAQRNTTIIATTPPVPGKEVAGNNESKGTFKSFLRKATRLIERKTGIDPTSGEEDELLIGAVAVKLK
jgi:hypothetical protein